MFPHLAKFLQSFKFKLFHCLQKQAAFLVLNVRRISYKFQEPPSKYWVPEHFKIKQFIKTYISQIFCRL